ncbi:hypothetical protein MSAN_00142800 [Mycena sanguinolenta]|uniref:C2H2-type domain-containing protein n=1 Tax=Mycena sanguinolenta TaxID=230812 RepID=A0A8H6ZGZ3_9AGAR|nr:hypothetical protein MSAN_00142800 [Mycena sanguinolenta]
MSLLSTPFFDLSELVLDDDIPSQSPSLSTSSSPPTDSELKLAAESALQALLDNESAEAIKDAFFGLVLKCPVPDDIDASTFDMGTRLALESITPEGKYLVPQDHLMHHNDPHELERSWTIRPIPTTPYGMGLSFQTSGWRAPAYRSPECREVESRCIDPALLRSDAAEALPALRSESLSPATTLSATDYPMSFDLDAPESVPVDVDSPEGISDDEVEEDEEDEDEDDAADSDFEDRVIRPLPRRAAPRAAAIPPSTNRSSCASAPVSKKPSSTKKQSPTRGASASTAGKKRKAASAPARRPAKKAAVSQPTTGSTSLQLPNLPGITGDGLPAPANSGGVSKIYWPLLRLGSYAITGGVRTGATWVVMSPRRTSAASRGEFKCDACPWTFSRCDALTRHARRMRERGRHFTAERKAFLPVFNALQEVVDKKNNCAQHPDAITALNKELDAMFDEKLAERRELSA